MEDILALGGVALLLLAMALRRAKRWERERRVIDSHQVRERPLW